MSAPMFGKDPIYWDLDGVPVACLPTPEGGCITRAFDVPEPGRPVTLSLALSEGVEVDQDRFEELKAQWARRIGG